MSEGAPFHRPIPFTQLLDETLKWSRRHWKAVWLPAAVPVAFASGLVPIAQARWFAPFAGDGGAPDLDGLFGGLAAFFGVVFFFVGVQFLASVAMIVAASRAAAGQPISMREAWLFGLRPRPFVTLLLAAMAVGAGWMCCLLPGIYIGCLFSMTVPVMVLEGLTGTGAIGRSMDLAQYNPTGEFKSYPAVKIFVLVFVAYLISMALSFAVQMPAIVVQQILMMRMMSGGESVNPAELMARMTWIQVPSQMIGAFVQMLMQLYISFGLALLYFDLKLRREGTDLEAEAARMGAPPAPEPPPAEPA